MVSKIKKSSKNNPTDCVHMPPFIINLNQHHNTLLLLGRLPLPLDTSTTATVIGKIYKIRTETLRELHVPWPLNNLYFYMLFSYFQPSLSLDFTEVHILN